MMRQADGRGCDRWIPWAFVAFFAVVFAANGALVAFAYRSWTGLTTTDAYAKGLAYNHTLADARAQRALGWQLELAVRTPAAGPAEIVVRLRDREGGGIEGAEVSLDAARPTQAGYDRTARLVERGDGRYDARLRFPLPGVWDLSLHVERQGATWRTIRRVEVP